VHLLSLLSSGFVPGLLALSACGALTFPHARGTANFRGAPTWYRHTTNVSVRQSIAEAVLAAIKRRDDWAQGVKHRVPFAGLREDSVKLAIARALDADDRWSIVDIEGRYREVPGYGSDWSKFRCDVIAIGKNSAKHGYLLIETKTGGPLRTDAGNPAEYLRQVSADLAKLTYEARQATVRRLFVGVVHWKTELRGARSSGAANGSDVVSLPPRAIVLKRLRRIADESSGSLFRGTKYGRIAWPTVPTSMSAAMSLLGNSAPVQRSERIGDLVYSVLVGEV
jgi:hypothetical protein